MTEFLLEVKELKTYFYTDEGTVPAVDGVSFKIKPGETLGIVGESGCGKSVTSMSIMRLVSDPPGKIIGGDIIFDGKKILDMSEKEMRRVRGNHISIIFQEPMTSLNPVFTIGNQISEALILHQGMTKQKAREKTIEMIKLVEIPRAEKVIDQYPHSLSGGMRQRVMIAMALACNPKLLIADEPTTALDVTIQAQILDLLMDLKDKLNTSIMLITHDMGVIAEMADHVIVMYAGKVVEEADVVNLFDDPKHPYSIGLHKAIPKIDQKKGRLENIPGCVPNPTKRPEGCKYHPRCQHAKDICVEKEPELLQIDQNRKVRCWKYSKALGRCWDE